MTKTAIATAEPNDRKRKVCDKCGTELKYSRKSKKWYCPQCLHGAFLTDQAQRDAVKRYRQSEKGKETEKKYEQSTKGKTARERYLKSPKYKAARKRYNERLKESLRIARAAQLPRAKALTREERLVPLTDDIREFIQASKGRSPRPADVIEWAQDEYHTKITESEAQQFIEHARKGLQT